MCRAFKKIYSEAWNGFLDGIAETFNPHYDKQEQLRLGMLRHISDNKWTDAEVYQEFLEYCRHYDPKLRLTRTNQVLDIMVTKRAAIYERIIRARTWTQRV